MQTRLGDESKGVGNRRSDVWEAYIEGVQMRSAIRRIAAAFIYLLVFCDASAEAAEFSNKMIAGIRGPDGRPCTFFTLEGVTQADPSTPGTAVLVLRQANAGYKENLALLLAAKLSGRAVNVGTTGAVVPECGHVEAYVIVLP